MVESKFSMTTSFSTSTGAEESKTIRPDGLMIQMEAFKYVSRASNSFFTASNVVSLLYKSEA